MAAATPQDFRNIQVEEAEAMQRLIMNEDFKMLFQDKFVDAFAITNVYNMHGYDDPARRRFLEKTLARSHFVRFIDETLEDGRQAIISLKEDTADEESDDLEEADY